MPKPLFALAVNGDFMEQGGNLQVTFALPSHQGMPSDGNSLIKS